jgi:hypothetical protein
MEGAAGGGDLPEVLARARTHSTAAVGRAMIASHADAGAPANVYPTAPWWAPYSCSSSRFGCPLPSAARVTAPGLRRLRLHRRDP